MTTLFGVSQAVFDELKNQVDRLQTDNKTEFANLQKAIDSKITDSEDEAKAIVERVAALETKALEKDESIRKALETISNCSNLASEGLESIQGHTASAQGYTKEIEKFLDKASEYLEAIKTDTEGANTSVASIAADFTTLKAALVESQKLPEQIESIKILLDESKTANENIKALLSHSMKKKTEIDVIHLETFGRDVKGADGTVTHTDGLVDELSGAYSTLESRSNQLLEEIENIIEEISENHETLLELERESFKTFINGSTEHVDTVKSQLTGLLPGALAEGLSAAYEKKKDDEIRSQEKYEVSFRVSIGLMVGVSLIPFIVDLYLLFGKKLDIIEVINNTPSMIFSILPLYFPVLWLAYSSNKKLNLSKRLIEEYTHKAVLGKTFSGLSNQIESLSSENNARDELRTRLLFNLLQVSSENPGKLISDYDKSDHPLMETLENSAKLSESVETLSKIPGFSAITRIMAARAENILEQEAKKVEDGLETLADAKDKA